MGDLSFLVWVTEWMVVPVGKMQEELVWWGDGKFSPAQAECKRLTAHPSLEINK